MINVDKIVAPTIPLADFKKFNQMKMKNNNKFGRTARLSSLVNTFADITFSKYSTRLSEPDNKR